MIELLFSSPSVKLLGYLCIFDATTFYKKWNASLKDMLSTVIGEGLGDFNYPQVWQGMVRNPHIFELSRAIPKYPQISPDIPRDPLA
jgi:hypothetical protein